VLAEKLGLSDLKTADTDEDSICKIGVLQLPVTEKEFAQIIAKNLAGSVNYSTCGTSVKTVAVCAGAGGEYYALAKKAGADALVTGEAKHHEFLGAKRAGIALYAAGHFETEAPAVKKLMELCRERTDTECVMLNESRTTEYTGAI
jgi:putative NIF3 family GTP cyclohydrolase 1 type 2